MKFNKNEKVEVAESTIESMDESMLRWIDKEMNLHCQTNKGNRKCPVLWLTPERSLQLKKDMTLRDKTGAIILPFISIERGSIKKGPDSRGGIYGQIPTLPGYDSRGGAYPIARNIIQQEKTANFANTEYKNGRLVPKEGNKKIVYETYFVPMPVYVSIAYEIKIVTNYQQQMNVLLSPFIEIGSSQNRKILHHEGHMYEVFIDGEFSTDDSLKDMGEEERRFESTISMNMLGYLLTKENKNEPLVTRRESVVEYKFPKEF
jgi:hypothetical protein